MDRSREEHMPKDFPAIFTDRREAINIFELFVKRFQENRSLLFPILSYIAPSGSGKSVLIDYLCTNKCSSSDGHISIPYARLDFAQADPPKGLLPILIRLRDQLWQLRGTYQKQLVFPRFDLGVIFALANATDATQPLLTHYEEQQRVKEALALLGTLGEVDNLLEENIQNILPIGRMISSRGYRAALQSLVHPLKNGPAWEWYKVVLALPTDATFRDIQLSLHTIREKDQKNEDYQIEQILAAAFLTDIRHAIDTTDSISNIVLFFDGYEELLKESGSVGLRLLEVLTLSDYYKHGEINPSFLVICSRQSILWQPVTTALIASKRLAGIDIEGGSPEYADRLYKYWKQQLPSRRKSLDLQDLYLEFQLHDFTLADTQDYLQRFCAQMKIVSLSKELPVEIHAMTHGYPHSLSLAANALARAEAQGEKLSLSQLEEAAIPSELLHNFIEQLNEIEREELIIYAIPRRLDIDLATLRNILGLPVDEDAYQRWYQYQRLTLLRTLSNGHVLLHPILRTLLLQRLNPGADRKSRYYQVHTQLREYYSECAKEGDELSSIEEVYHALSLGDSEPAIKYSILWHRNNFALWELLLDVVAKAPVVLIPPSIEQLAAQALEQTERSYSRESSVAAIIYYKWLLAKARDDVQETAYELHRLGLAYSLLLEPDRQANLKIAIGYYEAALSMLTRQDFLSEWAETQHDLGRIYLDLSSGDRQANLQTAMHCFETALEVLTYQNFPQQWAEIEYGLGKVYFYLPGGDRQANLQKAIACYQAALNVYDQQISLLRWADMQYDLGKAYFYFLGESRQASLQKAIECYELAQKVYTHENYAGEWAMIERDKQEIFIEMTKPGEDHDPRLVLSPLPEVITAPETKSLTPPTSLRARTTSTRRRLLSGITFFLLLIIGVLIATPMLSLLKSRFATTVASPTAVPSLNRIGVVKAPDGEYIGISDGTFIFDAGSDRADSVFKLQAAEKLRNGDSAGALALWQTAVDRDTSDAEAHIYLEDQRIIASGLPYITLIVGTTFGGNLTYTSRDVLQGAYVTQKEYNQGKLLPGRMQVRLLIASSATVSTYVTIVAKQIVQLAQRDTTVVGVMGWSTSSRALSGVSVLTGAHIPMVSQTASSDTLTGISSYFWRTSPPNSIQGIAGAKYAEQNLHTRRVALFFDPADAYSQSLGLDFRRQFISDNNQIVDTEFYTTGRTGMFPGLLQNALKHTPDLIYFAGTASDVSTFLTLMPTTGQFANLQILGGDSLYGLVDYPKEKRIGFGRLHFTAFAYPEEWDILRYWQQKPIFFKEYTQAFNDPQISGIRYGYNRPDGIVILSYDAMLAILKGSQIALRGGKKSITPDDLQQGLKSITGFQAFQGVSGQISFGLDGNPIKKAIVVLKANADGSTDITSVQGCFLLNTCT